MSTGERIQSFRQSPDSTGFVDYRERDDLTEEEKQSLSDYQDKGNHQLKWECEIPEGTRHISCYVENSALRFTDFKDRLSTHDYEQFLSEIHRLDSAEEKSRIPRDVVIFKGLEDGRWLLENFDENMWFTDEGFGSYSLNPADALSFAKPHNESIIMMCVSLKKGHKAVYLEKDMELLVNRGFRGFIARVLTYNPGEISNSFRTIVYYIEEV